MKATVKQLVPPLLWTALSNARARAKGLRASAGADPSHQSLEDYWDPKMAEMLDHWGEDNVWIDVQLLFANARGRVLDIACGTGKVMELLAANPAIEVHGFDISDMLIDKAAERGIARERLRVCDATKMDYANDAFDFGYSIGSLEHFTGDGLIACLQECKRVVRGTSFHQIPVSADGKDHGWIRTFQSYYNNSVEWWLERYASVFPDVRAVDSTWRDTISKGKWFVCHR
jgi:ubiquinone/menaquinone biosynthesis C-methylase UbiE